MLGIFKDLFAPKEPTLHETEYVFAWECPCGNFLKESPHRDCAEERICQRCGLPSTESMRVVGKWTFYYKGTGLFEKATLVKFTKLLK